MASHEFGNRQLYEFTDFVNNRLPEVIKKFSRDHKEFSVRTEMLPIQLDNTLEEDGTEFISVKGSITLDNHNTGESINCNVDLLKLPVFTPLGFKIRGNYLQVLDLYERASGWVLYKEKATSSRGTTYCADLFGENYSNLKFRYEKGKYPYVSIRDNKSKSEVKVPVVVFLRALTGMSDADFLTMFGSNAITVKAFRNYDLSDFSRKRYGGKRIQSRTDCLNILANLRFGEAVAKQLTTKVKEERIVKYYCSPSYFKIGGSNRESLQHKQSYAKRALGKQLAESIRIASKVYEEGLILTEDVLNVIDASPINELKVMCDGKVFCLKKFSNFSFQVYNHKLLEDVEECGLTKGSILSLGDVDSINGTERTTLKVENLETGEKSTVVRRVVANTLNFDDLFTALSIWFDNINGFDALDNSFSLTERVLVPYQDKAISIVQKSMTGIVNKVIENTNKFDTSTTALAVFNDLSRFVHPDEFMSYMTDSSNNESQMADMCNVLAFTSKSSKAMTNMPREAATPDLINVQDSQVGRLDPYDSPESSQVGRVHFKTLLADVNEHGFITAPFLRVKNGEALSEEPVRLTAAEESGKYVAAWDETFRNDDGSLKSRIDVRCDGNILSAPVEAVTLKEYSPLQTLSIGHALIPFANHSAGKRITMSCNQGKQATITAGCGIPIVGTGMEKRLDVGRFNAAEVLKDYYVCTLPTFPVLKDYEEQILHSDLKLQDITTTGLIRTVRYKVLAAEEIGNELGTKIPYVTSIHFPYMHKNAENGAYSYRLVHKTDGVYKCTDLLAYNTGCTLDEKETKELLDFGAQEIDDVKDSGLALGTDVVVGYKTFDGTTIEDSLTISSRLISDAVMTSVSLYSIKEILHEERDDVFTSDGVKYPYLDARGLAQVGTVLGPGDPVISTMSGEDGKIRYTNMPTTHGGTVISADIKTKPSRHETYAEVVIADFSEAELGDKFAGRYGNKGVVAKIVPQEQMPYDPETGLTLDIILNPLGVPSRQNLSQLLEVPLALCGYLNNCRYDISPYHKKDLEFVKNEITENDIHPIKMIDGRTGIPFERPINVGVMYVYKLHHMAHKKMHAIGTDAPVDPTFLQPRKGAKHNGGQSFGEMESWCLQGLGANYLLQEIYSAMSDDKKARDQIVKDIKFTGAAKLCGTSPELQEVFSGFGLASDTGVDAENQNETAMMACIQSLGVEMLNNTEEGCIEFKPLTNETVRHFSTMPVNDAFDLRNSAIFGSTKSIHGKRESRYQWSYIDLGAEIVHPIWIYKSSLLSIANTLEPFTRSVVAKMLAGKVFVKASTEDKRFIVAEPGDDGVYYYTDKRAPKTLNPLTGKLDHVYRIPKEEEHLLLTGMQGVVWILKNANPLITKDDLEQQLQERILKTGMISASSEKIIASIKMCNDFVSAGNKLSDLVIDCYPVMPLSYRPVTSIGGRESDHDFDVFYKQILAAVVVYKQNKSEANLMMIYNRIAEFIGCKDIANSKKGKELVNLMSYFSGKDKNNSHGKMREAIQSKRVFASGRAPISPADASMSPYELGVPASMLVNMLQPQLQYHFSNVKYFAAHARKSRFMRLVKLTCANQYGKFLKMFKEKFSDIPLTASVAYYTIREEFRKCIEGDPENDIDSQVVLAGRQPSLHKYSIRSFKPVVTYGKTIRINPLTCNGYNADFDGDQMWVYAVYTEEAKQEAREKLSPALDFINPKDSKIILKHSQDIVLGVYSATMLQDNNAEVTQTLGDVVFYNSISALETDLMARTIAPYQLVCYTDMDTNRKYLSTAGRVLFNSLFPEGFTDMPFTNPLRLQGINVERYSDLRFDGIVTDGKPGGDFPKYCSLSEVCNYVYEKLDNACVDVLHSISEFGFYFSDIVGVSLSIEDLELEYGKDAILEAAEKVKVELEHAVQDGLVSPEDKKDAINLLYNDKENGALPQVQRALLSAIDRNNNLFIMWDSGARGNATQLMHMCGAIGILQKSKTENMENPVTSNYFNGLSVFDVHMASYSSRTGVASTQNETRNAGYATRRVIYMVNGIKIVEHDCGKTDWWYDVEYDGLKEESCKMYPTKEWFEANLLGKQIKEGTVDSSMIAVDSNGCITLEAFDVLSKEGFNKIVTEDGTYIANLSLIKGNVLDDTGEFKSTYSKLRDTLKGGKLTASTIDNIERLQLKSVSTEAGRLELRYKLTEASKNLMTYREARNLPFLKEYFDEGSKTVFKTPTADTFRYIEDEGLERVEVRILLDCESKNGVCARCYGLRFSNRKLPKVGDNVGTEAAQSMGEPSAQLTMNLINKGGAAGESIASGVEVFGALLLGKFNSNSKDYLQHENLGALVANTDGWVDIKVIGNSASVSTGRGYSTRVPTELLKVKQGQWVNAGEPLTTGMILPDMITYYKDGSVRELIRRKQIVWMMNYYDTFNDNSIKINVRHFELLAKLQNCHAIARQPSYDGSIQLGDVVDIADVEKHPEICAKISTSSQDAVIASASGPLALIIFGDTGSNVVKTVTRNIKMYKDKQTSPISEIALGQDLTKDNLKIVYRPVIRKNTKSYKEEQQKPNFTLMDLPDGGFGSNSLQDLLGGSASSGFKFNAVTPLPETQTIQRNTEEIDAFTDTDGAVAGTAEFVEEEQVDGATTSVLNAFDAINDEYNDEDAAEIENDFFNNSIERELSSADTAEEYAVSELSTLDAFDSLDDLFNDSDFDEAENKTVTEVADVAVTDAEVADAEVAKLRLSNADLLSDLDDVDVYSDLYDDSLDELLEDGVAEGDKIPVSATKSVSTKSLNMF